jgi:hypothetical protein
MKYLTLRVYAVYIDVATKVILSWFELIKAVKYISDILTSKAEFVVTLVPLKLMISISNRYSFALVLLIALAVYVKYIVAATLSVPDVPITKILPSPNIPVSLAKF